MKQFGCYFNVFDESSLAGTKWSAEGSRKHTAQLVSNKEPVCGACI